MTQNHQKEPALYDFVGCRIEIKMHMVPMIDAFDTVFKKFKGHTS